VISSVRGKKMRNIHLESPQYEKKNGSFELSNVKNRQIEDL
jgi:hypothetical protein